MRREFTWRFVLILNLFIKVMACCLAFFFLSRFGSNWSTIHFTATQVKAVATANRKSNENLASSFIFSVTICLFVSSRTNWKTKIKKYQQTTPSVGQLLNRYGIWPESDEISLKLRNNKKYWVKPSTDISVSIGKFQFFIFSTKNCQKSETLLHSARTWTVKPEKKTVWINWFEQLKREYWHYYSGFVNEKVFKCKNNRNNSKLTSIIEKPIKGRSGKKLWYFRILKIGEMWVQYTCLFSISNAKDIALFWH